MTILSLKSNFHLIAWSIILGLLIDVPLTLDFHYGSCPGWFGGTEACVGWPVVVNAPILGALFSDLIFWILVALLILSLVRYFRNKKVLSKTN